MLEAAIDNDILIKGAGYGVLGDLVDTLVPHARAGVLAAAPFVVRNALRKAGRLRSNAEAATATFNEFLASVTLLEPSPEEAALAAELEYEAQRANLSLDSGESQLCAIVLKRNVSWLLTGDKRAIAALESLSAQMSFGAALAKRIVCLEQLFLRLLVLNAKALAMAVCNEPNLDKALTMCFACSSGTATADSIKEGLISYVGDLRKSAATLLAS